MALWNKYRVHSAGRKSNPVSMQRAFPKLQRKCTAMLWLTYWEHLSVMKLQDLGFIPLEAGNIFSHFDVKVQFNYLDILQKVIWDLCFQVTDSPYVFDDHTEFDFCISILLKYANKISFWEEIKVSYQFRTSGKIISIGRTGTYCADCNTSWNSGFLFQGHGFLMWKLGTKPFIQFKNTVTTYNLKQEAELHHPLGSSSWTGYLQAPLPDNSGTSPFPTWQHTTNFSFHCTAELGSWLPSQTFLPLLLQGQWSCNHCCLQQPFLFALFHIVPHAPPGMRLPQLTAILTQIPAKKPFWPDSQNSIICNLRRQIHYIHLSCVMSSHTQEGNEEGESNKLFFLIFSFGLLHKDCPAMGQT